MFERISRVLLFVLFVSGCSTLGVDGDKPKTKSTSVQTSADSGATTMTSTSEPSTKTTESRKPREQPEAIAEEVPREVAAVEPPASEIPMAPIDVAPAREPLEEVVQAQPPVQEAVEAAVGKSGKTTSQGAGGPGSARWIKITPLSTLTSNNARYPHVNYSSTYTRLLITSMNCSDGQDHQECGESSDSSSPSQNKPEVVEYPYSPRWWLTRLLFGIRHTITLAAKVTVGSFEATVPLVTIDHTSNTTDGESFARTVYHKAQNFPLFLIKKDSSNAIVSMKFVVKASSENKSNVAAAILQTAQSVAKAASPQSSILTTLTEQNTKNLAKSIDDTVSKVLATSVDEEQWTDNDIRYWKKKKGVDITFMIPDEGWWSWKLEDPLKVVGHWTITFEYPRPSIFSDIQICEAKSTLLCKGTLVDAATAAQKDTDNRSDEVLVFKLVNGVQSLGSVASYLKQQDWWATSQQAFAKSTAPGTRLSDDDVRSFCHSIKSTIIGLNLNSVDAGIVTMAVSKSGLVDKAVATKMQGMKEDCGHLQF